MTNPFDSNPFEEPADSYRGRGANPFAEPATPNFKSESPTAHERSPFQSGAVEPTPNYLTEPQADPQQAAQPAAPQEGKIHRFSVVKALLSGLLLFFGLSTLIDGNVAQAIGWAIPGAWDFFKSYQQKQNPTTPQKRHWVAVWIVAILFLIIGA